MEEKNSLFGSIRGRAVMREMIKVAKFVRRAGRHDDYSRNRLITKDKINLEYGEVEIE